MCKKSSLHSLTAVCNFPAYSLSAKISDDTSSLNDNFQTMQISITGIRLFDLQLMCRLAQKRFDNFHS